MVKCPDGMNVFEFAVLSGLRAAQLSRGCTPRVLQLHKLAVTAQMEIAEGKVVRLVNAAELSPIPVE
jgi:DNA-directed RNA polymerase subunit K/omega